MPLLAKWKHPVLQVFFLKHLSVSVPKSPLQSNVGCQVPSILILLLLSPVSSQTPQLVQNFLYQIMSTVLVLSEASANLSFPLVAVLWSWPPLTSLASHSRSALSTKPQSPTSALNLILILIFLLYLQNEFISKAVLNPLCEWSSTCLLPLSLMSLGFWCITYSSGYLCESHQVKEALVHHSRLCLLPPPSAILLCVTPSVNFREVTSRHLGHI